MFWVIGVVFWFGHGFDIWGDQDLEAIHRRTRMVQFSKR